MSPASKNAGARVHFIGLGGIGMSSLAQWFLANGWTVSGSDVSPGAVLDDLRRLGVRINMGHSAKNVPKGAALAIYTSAVRPDNPEFRAAKELGIPLHSYPEEIGCLTQLYKTIAVAGTHGKSTTTSLIGAILAGAGLDPTVIVGTKVKEFKNSNFRRGRSGYLVLEADEYKRALLNYFPTYAVLTTIDRDHLDVYRDLRDIQTAFLKFLARLAPKGVIVANADDPNIRKLKTRIKNIAAGKEASLIWYSMKHPLAAAIKRATPLSGRHNVSNALAAALVSGALGIPRAKILAGIKNYRGAWRRMEYKGRYKGAPVYDDYGHHPAEIKATLQAFREKYPRKRLICVFQPHQTERLEKLFKEFQFAFDGADVAILMPVYKVAGREKRSLRDSEALVRAMQKKRPGRLIFYLPRPKDLRKALDAFEPDRNSVIVMMGAGDIANYTPLLLKK